MPAYTGCRLVAQIMRKLSGAKEKLSLRVHGLIVGSPDKKRADPAVLRALCTNYLPNGKVEVRAAAAALPALRPRPPALRAA